MRTRVNLRVMLKINSKAEFAEEGTYFLIPQFFMLKYHQVKLEIKTEKNGQKKVPLIMG